MARFRTFVAVDIGSDLMSSGIQLIEKLSKLVDCGRWVRPENIHLTLKFLGEVEDRELHEVCKITATAAEAIPRFPLVCQGLGAFPNSANPSTIWMGVKDDAGILSSLQGRLETLLCDRLGIPVERRPYQGHITLGRITSRGKQNAALTELLAESSDEEFGILRVEEMVVFSSELRRQGPVYSPIGRCPLPK